MHVWFGNVPGRITDIASWETILASSKASHVVISCLDSNPRPARSRVLRWNIEKAGIALGTVGNALVINSGEFIKALSFRGLFTGFDEVWLHCSFPREGEICTRRMTSDGINLAEEVSEGLVEEFKASSAILGLGDGCGLNFITRRKDLAELIVRGSPPEDLARL